MYVKCSIINLAIFLHTATPIIHHVGFGTKASELSMGWFIVVIYPETETHISITQDTGTMRTLKVHSVFIDQDTDKSTYQEKESIETTIGH